MYMKMKNIIIRGNIILGGRVYYKCGDDQLLTWTLSLIMKKSKTPPNGRIIYRIIGLSLPIVSSGESQKKD